MSGDTSPDALISSTFDTSRLAPDHAYATWTESINVVFQSRLHRPVDEGFYAKVDAVLLGDVAMGHLRLTAQDFDRSRFKIARDGMDGFILQYYLSGKSASRSGESVAGPGDLYIVDMSRPLATATTDHEQISLLVPRQMLSSRIKNPDDLHLQVLPAQSPLVSLFRDSLMSFHQNLRQMNRRQADAVIPNLLNLAAAALDGRMDDERAPSVNLAQRDRVRRFIDANLLSDELSADRAMREFGLPRRTLYRLFEPLGGFSSYVNHRRLQRAFSCLRSSQFQHLTISEIAVAHGFSNPENFSRAFRREFGLSPRELRHLALASEVRAPLPSTSDDSAWSNWIRMIGR